MENTTDVRIEVTMEYKTEDGVSFWPGEVFLAVSLNDDGSIPEAGTEVKSMGSYYWIPASHYRVVG